jgi:hypothetical protein
MLLYWDLPLQQVMPDWLAQEPEMMIMNNIGEGYFVNHFFRKLDFSPEWTISDSDKFLAKYFCMIDKEQIDLFWLKYNRYFESIEYQEPSVYNNWIRRDFLHWTRTYRHNNY